MALHLIDPNMQDEPRGEEVILVLLKDLFVHRVTEGGYQRAPIESLVTQIEADWNKDIAQLITVNIRDNNVVALIDGQHRMLAAARRGIEQLPAYAHYGLSVEAEARLFLAMQRNRRTHRTLERWAAERIAGNQAVLAIDTVVARYGLSIPLYPAMKHEAPTAITCPETLMTVAYGGRGHGNARLLFDAGRVSKLLQFVNATWGSDPERLREGVLRGVDTFLRKYPHLDFPRAIRKIGLTPCSEFMQRAVKRRDMDGLSYAAAFCKGLQVAYDSGLRSDTLRLEPKGDETP